MEYLTVGSSGALPLLVEPGWWTPFFFRKTFYWGIGSEIQTGDAARLERSTGDLKMFLLCVVDRVMLRTMQMILVETTCFQIVLRTT
jgi:hypothetical protein